MGVVLQAICQICLLNFMGGKIYVEIYPLIANPMAFQVAGNSSFLHKVCVKITKSIRIEVKELFNEILDKQNL